MIVLDTHALVWWVQGTLPSVSRAAEAAIDHERVGGEILISSISAWEIGMIVARGRVQLAMDVRAWLGEVERIDGVRFVPVDNGIGLSAATLPGEIHGDPADRIIVATSRHFQAALVTGDRKVLAYPHVRTIW
jgi:PIN domain nuclease of toxin-antitoxin system